MNNFTGISTSAEVYAVIFARHRDRLRAFSSFSDPHGTFNGGPGEIGRMHTTWGFDGCSWPFMECRSTWDIDPDQPHKRINERHEYWLCMPMPDSE